VLVLSVEFHVALLEVGLLDFLECGGGEVCIAKKYLRETTTKV
jgi:hypothetical protein